MMMALVSGGAFLDFRNRNGLTALHVAADCGSRDAVRVSEIVTSVKGVLFFLRLSLCLRFNGHFPDGSGLAGTRTSLFWIFLELRMELRPIFNSFLISLAICVSHL